MYYPELVACGKKREQGFVRMRWCLLNFEALNRREMGNVYRVMKGLE